MPKDAPSHDDVQNMTQDECVQALRDAQDGKFVPPEATPTVSNAIPLPADAARVYFDAPARKDQDTDED